MKTRLLSFIAAISIAASLCGTVIAGTKKSFVSAAEAAVNPADNAEIKWIVDDLGSRIDFSKIVTAKDGYIVHGYKNIYSVRTIIKYNANQKFVWEIVDNTVSDFAAAPDGSIYTVGNAGAWGANVPYIAKYSDSGIMQWKRSLAEFTQWEKISETDSFDINCSSIEIAGDEIFLAGIYSKGKYTFALPGGGSQNISRTGTNFNAAVFKFDSSGQLVLVKDIASTTANSIRTAYLKKLENGNIVLSGYLNTTATAIPGLACMGGYDGFIMVLNSLDLSVEWVRMVHSGLQLYGMTKICVFKNTIVNYGNTSGSPATANSLLLLSEEERAAWPPGQLLWNAGDALIIGFDGDSENGDVKYINVQSMPGHNLSCAGITKDSDGNFITLYTVTGPDGTYSQINKIDGDFNLIWANTLGGIDHETQVYDVLKIAKKIFVLGNSNYRFNTNEPAAKDLDGFIMNFPAFSPIITPPTVTNKQYHYGEIIPSIIDGQVSTPGIFEWLSGQSLATGKKEYSWIFTPFDVNFEPYEGSMVINVLKANQPAPITPLTVEEITPVTIEFQSLIYAEYSLDGGASWQESSLFTGLIPGTKYNATYRVSGDENYNPSSAAAGIEVETLAVSVTSPAVAEGQYYYGTGMPALIGGSANIPGTFSWKAGQPLLAGTKEYTWVFTPENMISAPIEGELAVTILKADQTAPTATLTIKEVTQTTIEIQPIPNAEYQLDAGAWKESPLFENLTPGVRYYATYRLKGNENYNPSIASASIEIITASSQTDGAPSISPFIIIGSVATFIALLTIVVILTVKIKRKRYKN